MFPTVFFTNLDKSHDSALRGRFSDYRPKYTLDWPLPKPAHKNTTQTTMQNTTASKPRRTRSKHSHPMSELLRQYSQNHTTTPIEEGGEAEEGEADEGGGEGGGEGAGKTEYSGTAIPSQQREAAARAAESKTTRFDDNESEPGGAVSAQDFYSIDSAYIPRVSTEFNSMIICGPSQSGKSQACLSLLRRYVLENRYDRYVILSPTAHATELWDEYLENKDNIIGEFSEDALRELMDEQRKTKKEKRKRVMLVIDDCVASAPIMAKSKCFADLFCLARNYSMSICLLSQAINRAFVNKLSRVNATWLLCCGLRSKSCYETIRNDYLCPKKGDDTGLHLYESITAGRFNFCAMNLRPNCEVTGIKDWVHRYRSEAKIGAFKMKNDWKYDKIGREGHSSGKGLPFTSAPLARSIKEKEYMEAFEERSSLPTYRKEKVLKTKEPKKLVLY